MLGFDSLLKYADESPRPVIISLIGVLIAGGIGGGLFIQALQSSLAQRDAIEKAHLENIASAYAIDKEAFKSRLNTLASRADAFESHSLGIDDAIEKATRELRDLSHRTKPVPKVRLAGIADELDNSRRVLDLALQDMKRLLARPDLVTNSYLPTPHRQPIPSVVLFIFLLAGLAIASYFLVRRRPAVYLPADYGREAHEEEIIARIRRDFERGARPALIAHELDRDSITVRGASYRWTREAIEKLLRK
jgi:hypothetical protein